MNKLEKVGASSLKNALEKSAAFETNVEKDGKDDGMGKSRKELTLTFHESDGEGKISHDDILSLISSIFGAVNDLAISPSDGSKTLKLSLSIIPDKPTDLADEGAPREQNNNVDTSRQPTLAKLIQKVSVVIRETLSPKEAGDDGTNHSCFPPPLSLKKKNNKQKKGKRSRSQPPDLHELLRISMEKNNVCYSQSQRYTECSRNKRSHVKLYQCNIINECDNLNFEKRGRRQRSRSQDGVEVEGRKGGNRSVFKSRNIDGYCVHPIIVI